MIEADRVVRAFGTGTTVEQAARLAASLGFAVLAVSTMPGREKAPVCPLGVVGAKKADAAAQDAAAERGVRAPERVRHACGVHHATTDPAAAVKAVRAARRREHAEPNLGVEVGRSRVVLVDCDTAAEVDSWLRLWAERAGEPDRLTTPPTVSTPGKRDESGEWVHADGGHWYFTLPDDVELPELPGSLVLPDGAGVAYWRSRLALVPPSQRTEGPYRLTGVAEPVPAFLLEAILDAGRERERRRERVAQRAADGEVSPLDQWAASTPWAELLDPDGWTATGDVDRTCGCAQWTRPGEDVSSARSAIAHEVGCARFECAAGHGPLYLFTDHPPAFLDELVQSGRRTVTKVQYLAARDHDGDVAALAEALGLRLDPDDPELDAALDALAERAAAEPVAASAPRAVSRLELVDLHERTPSRTLYALDPFVPLGVTTLMPGEEGAGKTTLCYRLAADVSRGALEGDLHGTPRGVLILAPEDNLDNAVVPRLLCAGADMTRVKVVAARVDGDRRRGIELPKDLHLLVDAVEKVHAALVIVDSLVTVFPDDADTRGYKDVVKFLYPLNRFAELTGVAVLAPWHLNKNPSTDPAQRMMDSRGFRTASRSVVFVVRDPEVVGQGVLALSKANDRSLEVPALRFAIEPGEYEATYRDPRTGLTVTSPAHAPVARLLGPDEGTGTEVLERLSAPRMARSDDPQAWLRRFLRRRGETPRDDVLEAAGDAGLSERQVQRAARAIGVEYRASSVPRPGSTPLRRTLWDLPEASDDELDEALDELHDDGRDTAAPRSREWHDRRDRSPGENPDVVTVLVSDGRDGRAASEGEGRAARPRHDRGTTVRDTGPDTAEEEVHDAEQGREEAVPRADRPARPTARRAHPKHPDTAATEALSDAERVAAKVADSPGITLVGLQRTVDVDDLDGALDEALRLELVSRRNGDGRARYFPRPL